MSPAPTHAGALAVVTGASGGLGLMTARGLAAAGFEVVVAARDPAKGEAAAASVGGGARFEALDLADLASVRAFAGRLVAAGRPVEVLVNNAGLAAAPQRRTTRDGFELQLGTNHLGHFALTALLLPLLRSARAARVVSVSSLIHRSATIDFDDLNSERRYSPARAYGVSKLAVLLFALELQRRSDAHGWGVTSLGAHPGFATTELTKSRPGQPAFFLNGVVDAVAPLIGQSAAEGARPILHAALADDAAPGGYYGPAGFSELKGPPKPAVVSREARDPGVAARLWRTSETLTGVSFG